MQVHFTHARVYPNQHRIASIGSIGCTVKIRAFPILPIMEIYTHPHTPMGVAFALRCL